MNLVEHIYNALYDYCTAALTRRAALIPIVQAHQNAPAPAEPYIAIERVTDLDKLGQDDCKTISAGVIDRKSVYKASVKIWQVGADGEHLRACLQDLQRRDVSAVLEQRNLVIFNSSAVQTAPRLDDQKWVSEFYSELQISIAVSEAEDIGWIENVKLTENIGGRV